jgi:hypothetical protein
VSPDAPPIPRTATLRLKIVHAYGESPPIELPVQLRAPVLAWYGSPRVEAEAVRLAFANTGDQASGPLRVRAFFNVAGQDEPVEAEQTFENLAPSERRDLAIPIPLAARKAKRFSIRLEATTDLSAPWLRFPTRTWTLRHDLRIGLPFVAYPAALATLLLFGAGLAYLRIYRHPVVVAVAAAPAALKRFPLPELPAVDRALRRARRLDASLSVASLAPERWQRALRASPPGQARLQAFAEALGAELGPRIDGAPDGSRARSLALPPLRLRFAEQTALAVVEGRDLEPGAAARLAAAIHRGGAGPRQALVLDLTATQEARARLREVPGVAFVVLSAERLRDLLLSDAPAEVFEAALVEQVKIAELSPYQTAGGVEQEALFFGRERELRTMSDRHLRNFLLVGPRQMGKSTLLKALERRLHHRPDVEAHYVTLADADVTAHLAHHLDPAAARAPSSVEAFRVLAAGTPEKARLWLLDEADRFVADDAAHDYAITRAMRALAQDGLAYFVLAGYWHLYAAAVLDRDHPLLNFAEVVRLGPLDAEAARALATEPVEALGLRWEDAPTVEHLVEGTGQRANLIVLACKAMIESLGPEDRLLTRARLDAVLVQRGSDLAEALRVLRAYDPLDRVLVLQSFLLGEPHPDEVRAALRERGVEPKGAELEQALDRLMLGYILVRDEAGKLRCPVPFLRQAIERERSLTDRLEDDLDELRTDRGRPPR